MDEPTASTAGAGAGAAIPQSLNSRLPLIDGPMPLFSIVTIFTFFVLKWGPAFMKDRPPYNLRKILLVYNIVQIVANFCLFIYCFMLIFTYRIYDLTCMEKMPDGHPMQRLEEWGFYTYFLLKLLDFMDTIFFVLRKSFKQITFLHVYHHILMAASPYFYFKAYGMGGAPALMGILNTLVHCFMYGYYLYSSQYPGSKNSIGWKKHITHIQLVQFFIIAGHGCYTLFFRPDCQYPKVLLYILITQAVTMIILFGNFYIKTYVKKKPAAVADANAADAADGAKQTKQKIK